ncbi:TcaA NTF2-like domain-containing protein [Ectobacillus ponti]|uniref:TcaA protein NTF2-like domain-containing protein n=1 Tax=Ectobacillus ponti TaxID=2961894 RepID=A0AA42BRK1_9BACI|nr:hypothetical protein [Ectobacillus ponti]MCP8971037.1 hypothetical protein [Ectobacillus ponti]
MDFCRQCGQPKRRESDKVCTGCGSVFPPPVAEPVVEERKPQARSFMKWIAVVAVLGAAVGFGYGYVKHTYSMERFVNEAGKAVRSADAGWLGDHVKKEGNVLLSGEETAAFVKDLSQASSVRKQIAASLEEQREALAKGTAREPFVLQLQESKQRKWWVIPQYELVLVPVVLEFDVPDGAKVSLDGKSVKVSGKGTVSMRDIMPGVHEVVMEKDGRKEEATLEAWRAEEIDTAELAEAVAAFGQDEVVLMEAPAAEAAPSGPTLAQMQEFITQYLRAGVQTYNARDMQYVLPYVEPGSQLLKDTVAYLAILEKGGIYEELLGAEVQGVEQIAPGVYNVTVFSRYNISYQQGETRRFQSYHVIYQLVEAEGRFVTRRIVKEELVEKKQL